MNDIINEIKDYQIRDKIAWEMFLDIFNKACMFSLRQEMYTQDYVGSDHSQFIEIDTELAKLVPKIHFQPKTHLEPLRSSYLI